MWNIWNKLFKRKMLSENRIKYDIRLTNYEDLDFSLRTLRVCNSFVALPSVWYGYYNEVGTDHTVERLSKIEHIVENTDLIAESFFSIAGKYPNDVALQNQVLNIVLRIYLELSYQKLQTCGKSEIETLSLDFQRDAYIALCSKKLDEMPKTYQHIYKMMMEGKTKEIKNYMAYRKLRHAVGSVVRSVFSRR